MKLNIGKISFTVIMFLFVWFHLFVSFEVKATTPYEDGYLLEDFQEYKPDMLPWNEAGTEIDSSPESLTTYLISKVIDIIIYISGTLAVIGVIVGGARYMFSFGGEGKEQAKSTIIWSLVGLVSVLLSYAIVHNVVRLILKFSESSTT